jgi:hypothetical protein
MFCPTVGKSKYHIFYDLKKAGTSGVPDGILGDTGIKIFKTQKTENFSGKPEIMGSIDSAELYINANRIYLHISLSKFHKH